MYINIITKERGDHIFVKFSGYVGHGTRNPSWFRVTTWKRGEFMRDSTEVNYVIFSPLPTWQIAVGPQVLYCGEQYSIIFLRFNAFNSSFIISHFDTVIFL